MTQKLENNCIPGILSQELKFWVPHQAPSLRIWQPKREPPEHLALKASRTWSQELHRTGENRDSWRAPAHLVHPAPRAKEQRPHPRLSRPACEGLGVSCGRVGPPWGRSSDNSSLGRCGVLASVLLEEVPLGTTIEPPGGRSTNGRSYQVGEGQWQNKNCQTNKN